MKAFDHEWTEPAQDLLLEIWIRAKDRKAVTQAEYQAEKLLEQNPRTEGREMSEGLWQTIVPPLKIYYEIDEPNRIVTVTHVKTV